MDFQLVTFDPTTGQASYGMPTVPKIITGLDKLVQIVVLEFLRNPGRDVLAPNEGSGLRADIGQYNFTGDGSELRAHAVQRTRFCQQEILGRQNPAAGTPSERLKSLSVKNFAYDATNLAAMLLVQVTNEAGDSTTVLV